MKSDQQEDKSAMKISHHNDKTNRKPLVNKANLISRFSIVQLTSLGIASCLWV